MNPQPKYTLKTITVEAVAIKKTKKDGTPYTWKDKKANNAIKPRTMVSLKDTNGVWYMGWSYKDGSAAELIQKGQTLDIMEETSYKANPDGTTSTFISWRFPKQEDKDKAALEAQLKEIEALKAQLAAKSSSQTLGTSAVETSSSTLGVPDGSSADALNSF